MTNWMELARARDLDIPPEAVERIAPALDALESAFQPLLRKLTYDVEPAIALSEMAVLAE